MFLQVPILVARKKRKPFTIFEKSKRSPIRGLETAGLAGPAASLLILEKRVLAFLLNAFRVPCAIRIMDFPFSHLI